MIYDAEWRLIYDEHVKPRLLRAHREFAAMAARLRDVTVDVWTENPSDPEKLEGRQPWSLEGWRVRYRADYQSLGAFQTAHDAKLDGYDPQGKVALAGYLASLQTLGAAFAGVMSQYQDAGRLVQTKVSQAHRDALANAVEAELQ